MTSYLIPSLVLGLLVTAVRAEEKLDLTNAKLRASYSVGANIGANLKRQDLDLDPKALAAGLTDALAGKTALTEAEIRQTMTEFQAGLKTKMEEKQKVAGEKNLQAGEEFMAANGKKEGVKSGAGKSPKASDSVKVHYHGTLIDGTVFDSSVDRGEPVSFVLNEVIPGWTEALQLMKEGDKWQIYLPSKLAYGERGAPGGQIGPNAALIFDVELLAIEKAN